MIPGVQGRLLTASFIRDRLRTLPGVSSPPPAWSRHLGDYARRIESTLGAASGVRAVTEVALLPLVDLLGLQLTGHGERNGATRLELAAGDQSGLVALATG